MTPRLVAIESPFAGKDAAERAYHREYALAAMRDCLARGESPYASHLILTQVLDDDVPWQRELGIGAGLEWAAKADARIIFTDLGISPGMEKGIAHAELYGQYIEYRTIPGWAKDHEERARNTAHQQREGR